MRNSKKFQFALSFVLLLLSVSFLSAQLAEGTYVVDPSGNGDFNSIGSVLEELVEEGIDGPVVFELVAGRYEGPFQLGKIKYSSTENTVTFRSKDESPTAILTRSATTTNSREIVLLLGTKNITFENLTFDITMTHNARGINVRNKAENVKILNCTFNGNPEATGEVEPIVLGNSIGDTISNEGKPAYDTLIEGNSLNYGYRGIAVVGHTDEPITGIRIVNNKISNMKYHGIYLRGADGYEIHKNVIEMAETPSTSGEVTAILIYTSQGPFRITSNRIINAYRHGIRFGWYSASSPMKVCHVDTGEMAIIANNMIGGGFKSTNDHWPSGAIRIDGPIHNVGFYYNSINFDVSPTSSTTYNAAVTVDHNWISQGDHSTGLRFVNNSIAYTGERNNTRLMYITKRSSIVEMDYNNYYTTSQTNFIWYASEIGNLNSLRATDPTKNQNSRVGNPQYITSTDLHSYAAQLSGTGTPVAAVTVDIDDDERDPVSPCIGADEYKPKFDHDMAVINIEGPSIATAGTPETFKVTVLNDGRVWQTNYEVYLMRDTGETLAKVEVDEVIWSDQEEEIEIVWTPTTDGIFRIYALVAINGDENHNNNRYPVSSTFNVFVQAITFLPEPEVNISANYNAGSALVSWESIIGATAYKVFATTSPHIEDSWALFTKTSNNFVNVNLIDASKLFFRVVALNE